MNCKKILQILITLLLLITSSIFAENIDPYNANNQYAWAENVGWINFEPSVAEPNVGAQVSSEKLAGFIWAENIGWINLSPQLYGGVLNDGYGNLSGYAWAENVGWINFEPDVPEDANEYSVKIDSDGNFSGWAWGENIGWLNFGLTEYYVIACKVKFEDLANFAYDWLGSGSIPGNLDTIGDVDFKDYNIFASYWFDYCPDSWPLK